MKKIMRGRPNELTGLLAEVLREPLGEVSAILTERLRFIKWQQRLSLARKIRERTRSLENERVL